MKYDPFIFNTWRKTSGGSYSRGRLPTDSKEHPSVPYACYPRDRLIENPALGRGYWETVGLDGLATFYVEEWIVSCALKHRERIYSVPAPGRHCDLLALPEVKKIPESEWPIGHEYEDCGQGFMTSEKRFVHRHEAWIIATKAHQIKQKIGSATLLYSEDIWP